MLTDDEVDAITNSTPEEWEAAMREVERRIRLAMAKHSERLAWQRLTEKLGPPVRP